MNNYLPASNDPEVEQLRSTLRRYSGSILVGGHFPGSRLIVPNPSSVSTRQLTSTTRVAGVNSRQLEIPRWKTAVRLTVPAIRRAWPFDKSVSEVNMFRQFAWGRSIASIAITFAVLVVILTPAVSLQRVGPAIHIWCFALAVVGSVSDPLRALVSGRI